MKTVHEDANSVMVPGSTALREVCHAFYYDGPATVGEMFGDIGPLNPAPCLEPIDNDPIINALLAAENL